MTDHTATASERAEFLATMAHDFRTPLTALRGALGLLERRHRMPPEMVDQMVTMMRRASTRLERLVLSLITVEQIDEGAATVLTERLDVRDLVSDCAQGLAREHPRIEIDLPEAPVRVWGDRDHLSQSIDHLLDNARKFGGADGTIHVEMTASDGWMSLRVRDEGPGVEPADRERIFERFAQVADRRPNEPRGAGVGLYLGRWSAETMGGSLVLEGHNTFVLTLPLDEAIAK